MSGGLGALVIACGESDAAVDAAGGGGTSGSTAAGAAGVMIAGSGPAGSGGAAGSSAAGASGASSGGFSGSSGTGGGVSGPFPSGFGPAEVLVPGLNRPTRLTPRDGFLYFTEMGLDDGSESRLARRDAAGNVETLYEGNLVVALHLDDSELFFVERGTNTVYRMSYATLTPTVFTTTTLHVGDIERLGENYVITQFSPDGLTTAVSRLDGTGALISEVVPPAMPGFIFTYLAVGGGSVYLSTQGTSGGLFKIPPSGTGGVTVSGVRPQHLATDATHVYFGSIADGSILRQLHTADMSPEQLATGQSDPYGMALDGSGVYWTNRANCEPGSTAGSVAGMPLSGGAPVTVASGESCPESLATDAEYVYWVRNADPELANDDAILRARKLF